MRISAPHSTISASIIVHTIGEIHSDIILTAFIRSTYEKGRVLLVADHLVNYKDFILAGKFW